MNRNIVVAWFVVLALVVLSFGAMAYLFGLLNPSQFDENGNRLFWTDIPGERVCVDYINGTNETGIVAVGEECRNYDWSRNRGGLS